MSGLSVISNSKFPTLRILPVDSLVPHEQCDLNRALSLEERLKEDGVLCNPPVVTPLQDEKDQCVVLDGANRKNAFQRLGVPHILVQVVSPGGSAVNLKTWNQIVLGITPDELITRFSDIPDLEMKLGKDPGADNLDTSMVIQVHLPCGGIYSVFAKNLNFVQRVDVLNAIMTKVGLHARVERTHLQSIDTLRELHPDLAGLILFPGFKIKEILQLATERLMIPAGITRFIISPRALRVNYKISELMANKSLTEKEKDLRIWIQDRINQRGVRSYDEATVLFDE
jgi:hypothetical protein